MDSLVCHLNLKNKNSFANLSIFLAKDRDEVLH